MTIDRATQLQRFEQVYARIEADPASFDMDTWLAESACGTSACLAGHAVIAMGATVETHVNGLVARLDGQLIYIPRFAAEWLGLTAEQQDSLFYAFDIEDVHHLRKHVDHILNADPDHDSEDCTECAVAGISQGWVSV